MLVISVNNFFSLAVPWDHIETITLVHLFHFQLSGTFCARANSRPWIWQAAHDALLQMEMNEPGERGE